MGVSYSLCYLVKIVGIFMRGSDVQMEVLPADVNVDGHRSALICFSSWNMAFVQCLSLTLLPFFSLVFLPPALLPFLQVQQQVEMETLVTGVPSTKLLLVPALQLETSSAARHSSHLWSSLIAHSHHLASLQLLQILLIFLIWWVPLRQPWLLHKVWISLWWTSMPWASVYPCRGHRYAAICTAR